MSELRDTCENFLSENEFELCRNCRPYVYQVTALEAFAKEQQIKGMEAASKYVDEEKIGFIHDDEPYDRITDKIDAAIKQLKECG